MFDRNRSNRQNHVVKLTDACTMCHGSGKGFIAKFQATGPCQWCRTSEFMEWRSQFIKPSLSDGAPDHYDLTGQRK